MRTAWEKLCKVRQTALAIDGAMKSARRLTGKFLFNNKNPMRWHRGSVVRVRARKIADHITAAAVRSAPSEMTKHPMMISAVKRSIDKINVTILNITDDRRRVEELDTILKNALDSACRVRSELSKIKEQQTEQGGRDNVA